jgi:hypothetical protein
LFSHYLLLAALKNFPPLFIAQKKATEKGEKSIRKKLTEPANEEDTNLAAVDKKPKGRDSLSGCRELAGGKSGRSRSWKPNSLLKDPRKAGQLVAQLLEAQSDYLCLACRSGFASYKDLKHHAASCCATAGKCSIFKPSQEESSLNKRPTSLTETDFTPDLSGYVTGKYWYTVLNSCEMSTYPISSLQLICF